MPCSARPAHGVAYSLSQLVEGEPSHIGRQPDQVPARLHLFAQLGRDNSKPSPPPIARHGGTYVATDGIGHLHLVAGLVSRHEVYRDRATSRPTAASEQLTERLPATHGWRAAGHQLRLRDGPVRGGVGPLARRAQRGWPCGGENRDASPACDCSAGKYASSRPFNKRPSMIAIPRTSEKRGVGERAGDEVGGRCRITTSKGAIPPSTDVDPLWRTS